MSFVTETQVKPTLLWYVSTDPGGIVRVRGRRTSDDDSHQLSPVLVSCTGLRSVLELILWFAFKCFNGIAPVLLPELSVSLQNYGRVCRCVSGHQKLWRILNRLSKLASSDRCEPMWANDFILICFYLCHSFNCLYLLNVSLFFNISFM